ncbi:MAG: hypothetical protein A2W00_00830 [Candidatus Eisenbacteria bacterium RBG_16_71_46]|nr:MAG: hypothetical protein A2W00_00830 [Candidatus Eisenbacteria bacterium RBG_16_71_46]
MRRTFAWGLALVALAAGASAAPAGAVAPAGAPLAIPLLAAGDSPRLLLAQRAIEREWGPSSDSLYATIDLPGWRSEGLALALSAGVPGTGQYYAGEGSGIYYLVAEIAGWTARTLFRRRGDDLRQDAEGFAGPPDQSGSAWSFQRWAQATGQDPAELERLYQGDPEAFFRTIGADARYLEGWSGNPQDTRSRFLSYRGDSDSALRRARAAEMGLWLNHIVAAVDAMHAARLNNIPLQRNLELRIKSGWGGGHPQVLAAVEARF